MLKWHINKVLTDVDILILYLAVSYSLQPNDLQKGDFVNPVDALHTIISARDDSTWYMYGVLSC